MNKITTKVWGREVSLDFYFEQYNEENVLPCQVNAFERFLENIDVLDSTIATIRSYCKEYYEKETLDNIFSIVSPKAIYISRNEKIRQVAMLCGFKYDMDHGIALVFNNEKFVQIGDQDIIL